jgi:hypothetical protein
VNPCLPSLGGTLLKWLKASATDATNISGAGEVPPSTNNRKKLHQVFNQSLHHLAKHVYFSVVTEFDGGRGQFRALLSYSTPKNKMVQWTTPTLQGNYKTPNST